MRHAIACVVWFAVALGSVCLVVWRHRNDGVIDHDPEPELSHVRVLRGEVRRG